VRAGFAIGFAAVFLTPMLLWVSALETGRRAIVAVAVLAHLLIAVWMWTIIT
jgi:hypothetical protein